MTDIIQRENSASLQHVERFVHLQVPVDRYAPAGPHLLRAQGETGRAGRRPGPDENFAGVGKVGEALTLAGAEHVSLRRGGLNRCHC